MTAVKAFPAGLDLPDHVSVHEACCLLGLHGRLVRSYQAALKDRTMGKAYLDLGQVQGMEAALGILNIPHRPLALPYPAQVAA